MNIKPSEMFELCGMATKSAPVRSDVDSNQLQRSSGRSLSNALNGTNRLATSAPWGVSTTRCRFAPLGSELHSQPISAVNLPG